MQVAVYSFHLTLYLSFDIFKSLNALNNSNIKTKNLNWQKAIYKILNLFQAIFDNFWMPNYTLTRSWLLRSTPQEKFGIINCIFKFMLSYNTTYKEVMIQIIKNMKSSPGCCLPFSIYCVQKRYEVKQSYHEAYVLQRGKAT